MKNINFIVKNIVVFGLILFCSCNKNGSEPKDCLGVEGGEAVIDDCFVCSGGLTGQPINGNKDCNGVCFGEAVVDQCGVCGGNGSTCSNDGGTTGGGGDGSVGDDSGGDDGNSDGGTTGGGDDGSVGDDSGGDDGNSDGGNLECLEGYTYSNSSQLCTPNQFLFNTSTQQAAWFFMEVTLDGEMINPNDWVGAFTSDGSICVGARKWDTSECGGGVCEVPVLGADGENPNYMNAGQIPTFKIFRASDLSYHDTQASDEISWSDFGTNVIDCLSETDGGCSNDDKK